MQSSSFTTNQPESLKYDITASFKWMSIDTTASFKWMSIDTNFYTYTYISLSSLKYTVCLEFSIIISKWENVLGICQQIFTNTFIFTLTYTYTFHLHFHIFSYTYTFHLHFHIFSYTYTFHLHIH